MGFRGAFLRTDGKFVRWLHVTAVVCSCCLLVHAGWRGFYCSTFNRGRGVEVWLSFTGEPGRSAVLDADDLGWIPSDELRTLSHQSSTVLCCGDQSTKGVCLPWWPVD